MPYSRERIGDLLVESGVIDERQLKEALARQSAVGLKLGEILVEEYGISEERIAAVLAVQKGLEHVRLAAYVIDREAVTSIPIQLARRQQVIPIAFRDGSLVLAMSDPLDIEAVDEVRLTTDKDVIPVVATATEISHMIEKLMVSADTFREVEVSLRDIDATADVSEGEMADEAEDMPIVRLVNQMIRDAVIDRASDIHVEPEQSDVRVRYRVDGVLQEVMRLPGNARAGITSRIKVMADIDIAERRLPQDGRCAMTVDGADIDLRIATLPTPYGETITIRILHEGLAFHTLEDMGMSEDDRGKMYTLLSQPYGAVLHAGPTGSGKTTSLYAALGHINQVERKIITIEDPIEYRMDGVTQMAVRPKIGLTFAAGLRTVLRADPDVVMIGEMRDPETAEIGIRAALTGHLVLSSIHTNDAPSALTRLTDMDVPRYITSSALLGVVAQRLARRVCLECRDERAPDAEDLERAGVTGDDADRLGIVSYAVGCDRCAGTGYRGRVGLFEIMLMNDDLRKLFLHDVPAEALRETALDQGMRSLRDDAFQKVADGLMTLEELARVVV